MLPAEAPCPPEAFARLIEDRSPAFRLTLSDAAVQRLSRFLAQLDETRRLTNLTGRLTAEELVGHALESALGGKLIPHGAEVIDIGSGAGFPGLPIACCRPDLRVTAVEPRRKRAEFLKHAATAIPLENVVVRQDRAEGLESNRWDVATCRAVGGLEQVLAGAPVLRPGGLLLAWTTDAQELGRRLSGRFLLESRLSVPESRKKVIAAYRRAALDVPRGTRARD